MFDLDPVIVCPFSVYMVSCIELFSSRKFKNRSDNHASS